MDTSDCCKDVVVVTAKQGSTFHWAGTIILPAGDWLGYCTVRQSGGNMPLGDITVTLGTPTVNTYPIDLKALPAVTTAWNVKRLACDIIFVSATDDTNVLPTPTFFIDVEKQVTTPPSI